ncbi:TIGR03985 family CRISPR-associated protein [Aetokthonos hydrillicola Thurmond2011]|uniref:TIGR03985 family CRISPR-associated protein n=1 Tax=Aetokthonos hydrillicola Thurmond2011 TaxID=2712845 RepID=A0AAP5I4L8_9CYAN|nr:TIGR03985 family CRISPR-associated protein [Aetokthonos hydrillicola]MBO3458998.1 TIGR03985 family CRISPR-associated protein [Aetokthonos hydrillicola CCALA 1050]MBW4589106.1 TIGR03985 family CRISPR-associated protein [Aetokthonos hydrillicola CCALA 1050]MDR9894938.1 TIGR03985 family CRISPR-associated protein [Aetokthonos hydrillicola Thurmond2011]
MSNFEQFSLFPTVRLLDNLVEGSLNQSQNLITAMRRWRLINWFYGDGEQKLHTEPKGGLTFNEWCQEFFKLQPSHQSNHPQGKSLEKIADILKDHNSQCPCYKTIKDWLFFYGISVADWQHDLQKHLALSEQAIQLILKDRLFAKTRKTLQNDINFLKDKKCLQFQYSVSKRQNQIYQLNELPSWIVEEDPHSGSGKPNIPGGLNPTELADLAQALDMLTFLDPKLAPIADQISHEVSGTRRVFLHVDYVVPEKIQDEVDSLQEKLQENWRSDQVKLILFYYHSARLGKRECLVYPVCIYYVQRAKYLCAYGVNPEGHINWYNYRLERIKSEKFLEWSDTRIPEFLLIKYHGKNLPKPEDVQDDMKQAWGFDFYQPSGLMLLRFNRVFHESHIKDTFRHETFTLVKEYQEIAELIHNYANHSEQEKHLIEILQRFPEDAYYTAFYRENDNNVIMRLRAWGPNVEILLPEDLRSRMADDIRKTWKLYQD